MQRLHFPTGIDRIKVELKAALTNIFSVFYINKRLNGYVECETGRT